MRLSNHGLSVTVGDGWDHRIFRRTPSLAEGERTLPILHASTRPLPADRGDFGSGVVDLLGAADIFISLVEFEPEHAGYGLYAAQGMPRLAPSQFSPSRLQRVFGDRSASQHFFTEGGRAFCLFVVLGSHARRMAVVPRAARKVNQLNVERGWSLM
ncbi:MAG: hypothetical protein ACXVYY_15340 [Oryzihumus sp.]